MSNYTAISVAKIKEPQEQEQSIHNHDKLLLRLFNLSKIPNWIVIRN